MVLFKKKVVKVYKTYLGFAPASMRILSSSQGTELVSSKSCMVMRTIYVNSLQLIARTSLLDILRMTFDRKLEFVV